MCNRLPTLALLASWRVRLESANCAILHIQLINRLQSVLVEVQGQLPVRWCSPEALNYGHYSKSSDIWALGQAYFEHLFACVH